MALIGKYFIGVHDDAMRSGVVEAAVGSEHFLVRFDEFIGFTDGSKWPESLAVVAISDIVGNSNVDEPGPWFLFDSPEQRAKYEAWLNQPPPSDGRPRVVRLRDDKKPKPL
jgi:hypothetical protein